MSVQWSLVLFTVFTGAGGWMAACLAFDAFSKRHEKTVLTASVVALICLVAGGLFSVTHLAHPNNMLAALSHPTSGIFTEAVLVFIAAAGVAVYAFTMWRHAGESVGKVCLVIGAIAGVLLSFMAGASYMMSSCRVWNTPLLPLAYLGTAAPLGITAYLTLVHVKENELDARLAKVAFIAGIVGIVTALLYTFASGVVGNALTAGLVAALLALVGTVLVAVSAFKLNQKSGALVGLALVAFFVTAVLVRVAMWLAFSPINALFSNLL